MYSREGGDFKNSLKTLDSDLSIGITWQDWFNEASFTRLKSAPTKKGLSAYFARSALRGIRKDACVARPAV